MNHYFKSELLKIAYHLFGVKNEFLSFIKEVWHNKLIPKQLDISHINVLLSQKVFLKILKRTVVTQCFIVITL